MLVYLKEPMGYTVLDGFRVYGRNYAFGTIGPVNLPYDVYGKNKDILVEAKYTKDWLERKYGKQFPDISFTSKDLDTLDFNIMSEVANLIGIKHHRGRGKPTDTERRALKRSILLELSK